MDNLLGQQTTRLQESISSYGLELLKESSEIDRHDIQSNLISYQHLDIALIFTLASALNTNRSTYLIADANVPIINLPEDTDLDMMTNLCIFSHKINTMISPLTVKVDMNKQCFVIRQNYITSMEAEINLDSYLDTLQLLGPLLQQMVNKIIYQNPSSDKILLMAESTARYYEALLS